MTVPRSEHPKPQFMRENWLCLNGEWDFCLDQGRSGEARGLAADYTSYDKKIVVPFCPQSALSGLGIKDFLYGVWYHRAVELTGAQVSGRTFLHVGAADYRTKVFVNGEYAGCHEGGYVSFSVDVSAFVKEGKNDLTIYCEDDERAPLIPRGKQSEEYYSHGCDYTRTTGIWQSVWLEFTPKTYIRSFRLFPNVNDASVTVCAELEGQAPLKVVACYDGKEVGEASCGTVGASAALTVKLSETHLWEAGHGRLYDLVLKFGEDEVRSYFGLREVRFDGYKFLLNGKSVFQRLVLDQGFYPPARGALRRI